MGATEAEDTGPPPSSDEPIVALLDGLPLARHRRLDGRVWVDDPNEFEDDICQHCWRQHGTAMASLIVQGDINDGALTAEAPALRTPNPPTGSRVIVTHSWFTPVHGPSLDHWARADLYTDLPGVDALVGVKREDVDSRTGQRGTVQHPVPPLHLRAGLSGPRPSIALLIYKDLGRVRPADVVAAGNRNQQVWVQAPTPAPIKSMT